MRAVRGQIGDIAAKRIVANDLFRHQQRLLSQVGIEVHDPKFALKCSNCADLSSKFRRFDATGREGLVKIALRLDDFSA